MEKNNKNISRREFINRFKAAAATVGATSLIACGKKETSSKAITTYKKEKSGGMTYRTTPTTGDKVSLLGYGCLRWFSLRDKETGIIDQEGVNELVDYAIEHGVNYFDTAPVYCDGEIGRASCRERVL